MPKIEQICQCGGEENVKEHQRLYIQCMKKVFLSLFGTLFCLQLISQDIPAYDKKSFVDGRDSLPYRILYPLNFKAGKKYPVLVFLHGSGERGRDNIKQLVWGGALFADSMNRKKYPAIVIFPQCPLNDFWALLGNNAVKDSLGGMKFYTTGPPPRSLGLVMKMLDSLVSTGIIDTKRIYVGGLSMGGMGTFEILWRKPGFFAAALPVCGAGAPDMVPTYAKNFPIWIFHGDKDPAVPVGNSRLIVNAHRKAGAKVRYSEYPGVGHDSWNNALAEPDFLKWLFKQKKKS